MRAWEREQERKHEQEQELEHDPVNFLPLGAFREEAAGAGEEMKAGGPWDHPLHPIVAGQE